MKPTPPFNLDASDADQYMDAAFTNKIPFSSTSSPTVTPVDLPVAVTTAINQLAQLTVAPALAEKLAAVQHIQASRRAR